MATETLILHSDLNCYYASVEMNEHPELRGKKVAVCGSMENRHGIVLTANYPAKRSGVKTGMANWQAKQACTDLIMVDPHYDLYLRYSKIVRSIYKRYADCIEPFGMDENWISIPCCKSIDQDGLKLAEDIRKTVREETGLTVSIGVSFSKTFAKDILVEADHFDDPLDKDQINALLFWFRDKLLSKYPLVVGEMISIDFMNKTIEYFTTDKEKQRDWINSCLPENKEDSVSKYILEGTHYTDYGDTTNGQFLLTLCYNVSFEYCLFKGAFLSFAKSDESPEDLKQAERLLEMYGAQDNVQDIEFRIMGYDGRFNSVYTIKSFFSLLLFEMAHIIDEGVNIVKCKNCGQYFVPLKRSDTRYCNYPSPENPEKTCKEIGAQKAWANKEKTDDTTREYRKVYMRYKMTVKRHPDNQEAQQKLDRLTDGIKEWRQKLDAGEAGTADFMRWLEEF